MRCWGNPATTGRLGIGVEAPDEVGDDEEVLSRPAVNLGQAPRRLSTSNGVGGHTCAILADDSVLCWGDNSHGQLGYGHIEPVGDDELPVEEQPVRIL